MRPSLNTLSPILPRWNAGRWRWLPVLVVLAAAALAWGCNREPAGTPGAVATPVDTPRAGGAPAEKPAAARVYRLGIFSDLTTTNMWALYGSGPDNTIWNSYVLAGGHPSLYGYSDQRFDWIPSVADGFPTPLQEETVQGRTLWTTQVNLRQGVKWSDGRDVTADDFVFTARTAQELELTSNWVSLVDPKFYDHAEAVGPYQLKVFFKQKPGLSIWQFGTAFMPMLSQAYWSPVVAQAKQQADLNAQQRFLYSYVPVNEPTAGGYAFKRWEKGAFAERVKNPGYYFAGSVVTEYVNGAYSEAKPGVYSFTVYGEPTGAKTLEYTTGPYADSVIYAIYGNQEAAVLALKKGDIDMILNPNGLQRGLQEQVKGQPEIASIENPANSYRYLGFNVRKPPMDNLAFRKAVAILIDKEFISRTVLQGAAIPMDTTVPPGNVFWYNSSVPTFGKGLDRTQRLAEAMVVLKAAGFAWETEPRMSADGNFVEVRGKGLKMPNGQLVPDLELLAPSAGYDPLRATFAIWIERWLTDVGIPVRANLTGFNVIVERINDPQGFDMWMLGWSLTQYPDYLEAFFHSRHAVKDGLNRGGYANPEFDRLADQLLVETDLQKARQIVFQLQQFLAEDLPYVVLYTTPVLEVYRSDRLTFPYTETLDGIQDLNGLTTAVVIE